MKVTALLPDELVDDIRSLSKRKTLTEALIYVLDEWRSMKKLQFLTKQLKAHPLKFQQGLSAHKIRSLNRKR
ncbi:MAG: DUF2191 domain-containing protein [Deltaproteobacteria bacterium]|nr:DUF2191 domain-containing protein [Deltaproteobacteria bacterium]